MENKQEVTIRKLKINWNISANIMVNIFIYRQIFRQEIEALNMPFQKQKDFQKQRNKLITTFQNYLAATLTIILIKMVYHLVKLKENSCLKTVLLLLLLMIIK